MKNLATATEVNLSTLWWATLVGAMGSVIANVVFLFIYELFLGTVYVPDPAGGIVAVGSLRVAIFSFVPGLGAGILLWALNRFTTNPVKKFTTIATVVLAISFLPDIAIASQVGWSSAIALMIMHVISAVVILGSLRQFALS
jgi:hypothetical protein